IVAGVFGPRGDGASRELLTLPSRFVRADSSLSATEGVGTIMRSLPATPCCVRRAVLVLLGIGVAWVCAAEPIRVARADEPGKSGKESAKPGDKKPDEKKFKFTVAKAEWDKVFNWLKEETGKPVISKDRVTGTCQVLVPEGATYTLPQTIDLINQALLDQKYILIQRKHAFVLVPADEKIDPVLLESVDLKDLDKHGETEVVKVLLDVKGLAVEDIQAEVQKMLSKFGDVYALPRVNKFVLTDTVASIRQIEKTLREGEDATNAETFTHTCKFKKARDVERVLKDLLGDPKAEAAKQPPLPPGVDPRFRPPGLPPPTRAHSITSDEAKNMVLVTGPADIISKAKDIVKTLDKGTPGQPEYKPGEAKLMTFEVPTGKAEPIAKTLT